MTFAGILGRASVFLALLSILLTGSAVASDSARLDALEARVQALEERLARFEAIGEARLAGKEVPPEPVEGGWRKAYNWGLLDRGMEDYEVEAVLGEPDRTKRISKFDHWLYGDGRLRFYLGRLKSWDLPSNLEAD